MLSLAGGERAIVELVMATHAGMTTEEFEQIATDWIATARHPGTGKLYTEMVYQPMLELLTCLRANGFTIFIASAGGIEFMRPWTERVYGIPREQVIGSSIKTKYELRDGRPVLVRLPELNFIGDKAGKPVGIQQHIGRRPIAAFGNSDGDFEMLEWVTSGAGPRFGLARSPRRCRARVRLRPRGRYPENSTAVSMKRPARLDRGEHEARLEADFCIRMRANRCCHARQELLNAQ